MVESDQLREPQHVVTVLNKSWLSSATFELTLQKPSGFQYHPGQKIVCSAGQYQREYSLVSSPLENTLVLCIRKVEGGPVTGEMAQLEAGDTLSISEPYGFLQYRGGQAVFIATGTGVAPFVSYARAGVRGFILLHGVRQRSELYYRSILEDAASLYVPCLSAAVPQKQDVVDGYHGRVTDYLLESLVHGTYDYYLSGNGKMIGEAINIIDRKFPASRIFTERFF